MGENVYTVRGFKDDYTIQFSDVDDEWACLCTFPGNNNEQLDHDDVRSLALLGAAVVLAWDDKLEYGILPNAVPEWIRDGIKRIVPITKTCRWTLIDEDCNAYETSCGNAFCFTEGDPADNKMQYCPYCGLTLKQAATLCEHPATDVSEDEDD